MEYSQSAPSVIARLMGLDELPPQQPVRKPQRVLSESYLQRVASIGVREKRHKHHPSGTNFEEKKQFGSVLRVAETTKRDEHLDLSDERGKINLGPFVEKVAVTRQKCITTKCSSLDEKLRNPEEFQDSSDVINSKNDRFQIYPPEGNSSSIKNIHDLQGSFPFSHSGDMTVLKSSCTSQSSVDNCRKSGSKTGCGYCSSVKKHEHGIVTGSFGDLGLNMHLFARSQFVLNNFPRTRIVVLKPKHGKVEKYPRYSLSLSSKKASQSGDNNSLEFPTPRKGIIYDEVKERKNLESNVEPTRQQPLVSMELLEKLTGRIRSKKADMLSRLGSRVGDTFAVLMPPSLSFPDCNNRNLSFSNSDAYMPRGAKKQLLKHWKMNKRSDEVGLVSGGSTLGEMLAMPDHNLRPRNHKPSWHGKKDLGLCKFSTKQSKHDALYSQRYLGQEESVKLSQHKSMKYSSNQEDCSEPRNQKNNHEKSQCLPCLNSEGGLSIDDDSEVLDALKSTFKRNQSDLNIIEDPHSSPCSISSSNNDNSNSEQEIWVMKDEKQHNPEDGYMSQQNTIQELLISTVASVSMVDDLVVNAEMKVAGKPSGNTKKENFVPTTCKLSEKDDGSSSHSIDTTIEQETSNGLHEECSVFSPCSFIDSASQVISDEAYQPSPVSVLEPPFTEEFSSIDLCSLHRHLQHLKSNSLDTHSEGPGMTVSSDDETEEGSAGDSKETEDSMRLFRVEESRDFSYLVDVLTEAGFHSRNLKMDFSIFHSPECPISLSLFETLEKKFGDQMSWKRSERRLLFDRINAGLVEILLPCMGVPTWAKPISRRLSLSSDEDMIEEDLWMLLVSLEKEASKDSAEKVLGNKIGKLELGDDIDAIGKEIERWLIDELAAELLA